MLNVAKLALNKSFVFASVIKVWLLWVGPVSCGSVSACAKKKKNPTKLSRNYHMNNGCIYLTRLA